MKTSSSRASSSLPPQAEAEYRRRNQKIKVDYIGFSPAPSNAPTSNPPPKRSKLTSTRTRAFYNVPETRDLQIHRRRSSQSGGHHSGDRRANPGLLQRPQRRIPDAGARTRAPHSVKYREQAQRRGSENPGASRGAPQADQGRRRTSPSLPRRTPRTPVRPKRAETWVGCRAARWSRTLKMRSSR